MPDFANLHFVTPQLAVGGDLSSFDDALAAQQFEEIVQLGITHIVDVRLEWSDLDTFADARRTSATCTTAWTTPGRPCRPSGSRRR
jgi:hypothetical protein